jgi:hypothetical protein
VSAVVAPHTPWAFDDAVADGVDALAPLYALAASTTPPTFINLDMEEYKDLDLTIAVFTRLLERPELRSYSAGIVLQTYLPDALGAMTHLQQWAAERVAGGGAPIKVRVVKGANLPMETVDAELAAGDLGVEEGHRRLVQGGPRLRPAARAHPGRTGGGGGAQPVRRGAGDAARAAARRH